MATYGPQSGAVGQSARYATPYVAVTTLDMANAIAGGATGAAADVYQVIDVPARSVVLAAGIYVVTQESVTAVNSTVALGDGTVTYVAATNIDGDESTTGTFLVSSDALAELGVTYAAANTLDVTIGTAALTDAVIQVWAIIAPLAPANDTDYNVWS
jgi:hypothetical protein